MGHAMMAQDLSRFTGGIFLGVLLGLILKATLDNFSSTAAQLNDVSSVWELMRVSPLRTILYICQLGIFLLTLVRFYLGTFRYYQEKVPSSDAVRFVVDFFGAVGVFIAFYVAAKFIRTTNLFYVGLFLIHFVDLVWFECAQNFLTLGEGLRKVASRFVMFDLVTIVFLLIAVRTSWSGASHRWLVWQFLALAVVLAVGVWDFVAFWPFYIGAQGWESVIPPRIVGST